MESTALERFVRIAAGAPSEQRWTELFANIGEWPQDPAIAEVWTTRANEALAAWPAYLRAAVVSDYDVDEPQAWMWGLEPETEAAPWLALRRPTLPCDW